MLSTDATQQLLSSAANKAAELGIHVNVAIVDGSGLLCGFIRMEGAHIGASDIAIDKAWTSVSFGGHTTRDMSNRLEGMREVVRDAILRRPRYTPLTGGLPIRVQDRIIGAIGVAGGTPDQDEACASAGLQALGADPIQSPT